MVIYEKSDQKVWDNMSAMSVEKNFWYVEYAHLPNFKNVNARIFFPETHRHYIVNGLSSKIGSRVF